MFNNIFRYSFLFTVISVHLCDQNPVIAQAISYDLPFSSNYGIQPFFHNPSHHSTENMVFAANFRSYTGLFSDVNFSSIYGLKNLTKKRAVGGLLLHENTSDFFTRSRFYLIYQEKIYLNRKTLLSAGMQVGGINFRMIPVGFSTGGSAWSFDLGIGFAIYNPRYSLGLAIQQIPNVILRPIIFEFKLDRFSEIYANYIVQLSPYWNYIPEFRTRLSKDKRMYSFSNTLEYDAKIGINASTIYEKGFSLMGFFTTNNRERTNSYKLFFSYFMPFNKDLKKVDAQQYEIGLNLTFKNREKNKINND